MPNLPEAFLRRMKERLGKDFPAFLASYEEAPYKGLRVNTLKISPAEFSRRAPFPLGGEVADGCFYLEEEKPGADPYHFAGLYYLQEPSAMTVAPFADPCKKERVLDLCAAPGGKTTQIAAKMRGEGILIANEIDPARAKILSQNVERMGIANCAVTSAAPEKLAEKFPAYFDTVLVDAPCSGEGMFKKEPNAIPEWSEQNVARCALRQRTILDEAAKMLCAGGRLIYSTCTFAEEEDEWQIGDFLRRHPAFSLLCEKKLYPHEFRGEGHFCAVLEKNSGSSPFFRKVLPRLPQRAGGTGFSRIRSGLFRRALKGRAPYPSRREDVSRARGHARSFGNTPSAPRRGTRRVRRQALQTRARARDGVRRAGEAETLSFAKAVRTISPR